MHTYNIHHIHISLSWVHILLSYSQQHFVAQLVEHRTDINCHCFFLGLLYSCFSCFITARITFTGILYPQWIYMIHIIYTSRTSRTHTTLNTRVWIRAILIHCMLRYKMCSFSWSLILIPTTDSKTPCMYSIRSEDVFNKICGSLVFCHIILFRLRGNAHVYNVSSNVLFRLPSST